MSKASRPRAVIHRRILDVAQARPDAPIETISEEVNGATFDLVERVLEEYGDPTDEHQEPMNESDPRDDLSDRSARYFGPSTGIRTRPNGRSQIDWASPHRRSPDT